MMRTLNGCWSWLSRCDSVKPMLDVVRAGAGVTEVVRQLAAE